MTDHPPQNQWDVNMVEGCHNGWYGQYLAAILLWNLFWLSQADDIGMTRIKFVQVVTFALVTPLEYLYPMIAYCEGAPLQIRDTYFDLLNLVLNHRIEIVYNAARKFGTISYSFMTFFDCFYILSGRCAGIRSGRFWYLLLDYRNFFQEDKLNEYI